MRRLLCVLALTVGAIAAVAAPAAASGKAVLAPASARGVTEFAVEARWIRHLSQALDGTITYLSTVGPWQHREQRLARVGQEGPLGETPAPNLWSGVVFGTEGGSWAITSDGSGEASVSRSTSGGAWAQEAGTAGARFLAQRAAGGVWFLQMEPGATMEEAKSVPKVGYVTPAGLVTSFTLPEHEAGYGSIVEGHEGDAWFTEYLSGRIARMTPSGELSEFPLPAGSRPVAITVAADGNFWFTEPESGRIGRITPAGAIKVYRLPSGVRPRMVAAGADGRIWFTEQSPAGGPTFGGIAGHLGRITPAGRFTRIELPNAESTPEDVIAGSEGNVWYSAIGEEPCEGDCLMWEPPNPAIIGRVEPTRLKAVVTSANGTVGRYGVRVPLACEGGDAWNHCRGRVSVKLGGRKVASRTYSLEADQISGLLIPFSRNVNASLGGRARHTALVSVVPRSGGGSRRKVDLHRAATRRRSHRSHRRRPGT